MLKHLFLAVAVSMVATPAVADLVINATQQGNNVVFEGSGDLAFGGLTSFSTDLDLGYIWPSLSTVSIGPTSLVGVDYYMGVINGPSEFGAGTTALADSATGDIFAVSHSLQWLWVPSDYTAGSPLAGSMTFNNTTLADLGVDVGTYVWSWGPGSAIAGTSDVSAVSDVIPGPGSSITLNVIAVPEPSAFLYGGLISVLAGCGYRIKRQLG